MDTTDPALVAARAAEPSIEVSTDPDDPWTRVNGRDVSADIRTEEVSAQVSAVARVPAVREHLIAGQRAIIAAADPGVVAEGRDIGTVVAPAAQLKVFLTADPGARARRRAAELSADAGETEAAQARRDRLDAAQSEKAADALLLDATDLTLDEVIDTITRLARERGAGLFLPEGAELVGLPGQGQEDKGPGPGPGITAADGERQMTDIDAADDGWVDIGDEFDDAESGADGAAGLGTAGQPVLAVVGRPNVGKSTLVNRILGSRQAVVQDVPGVTRDRVAYDANWRGRQFTLVDTGGWVAKAQGLAAQVAEQAEIAVGLADAVLFVVDARVGATDEDEAVARVLRRAGKPVVLVANKVDDAKSEADAQSLWSLGLGEPVMVSAMHGRGSGDMLDHALNALPEAPPESQATGGPRRVALIGQPNVGKSPCSTSWRANSGRWSTRSRARRATRWTS